MSAAPVTTDPSTADANPVILVVDDEVLIRLVVSEYLRDAGFTVLEAANAREAVEVLVAHVTVDFVFSDINMPGERDGIGLADWFNTNRPEIPILLTSAAAQPQFTRPDAQPFLAKPYSMSVLENLIRRMLKIAPSP